MVKFDLQPSLEGKIVALRPLQESDFTALYQVASDRLIWDQHPFPRYEIDKFKEFFNQSLETRSALVILDQQNRQIIGTSRYYNLTPEHVYIGYTFLARSYWGGVFNRELKDLMLEHAFKYVDKVYFDIGEHNLRSRRAIEKIGAEFVRYQELKGKPYTLYCMSRIN